MSHTLPSRKARIAPARRERGNALLAESYKVEEDAGGPASHGPWRAAASTGCALQARNLIEAVHCIASNQWQAAWPWPRARHRHHHQRCGPLMGERGSQQAAQISTPVHREGVWLGTAHYLPLQTSAQRYGTTTTLQGGCCTDRIGTRLAAFESGTPR